MSRIEIELCQCNHRNATCMYSDPEYGHSTEYPQLVHHCGMKEKGCVLAWAVAVNFLKEMKTTGSCIIDLSDDGKTAMYEFPKINFRLVVQEGGISYFKKVNCNWIETTI